MTMKCEVPLREFEATKHDLCIADLENLYSHWREQINAENVLYNQRIIWLITIQAFLYATVGLLFRARYETDPSSISFVVDGIILVVCGLGLAISLMSRQLLTNARTALEHLREGWAKIAEKHQMSGDAIGLFPHISGGDGKPGKSARWYLQSGRLPTLFTIAWLFFGGIIVAERAIKLFLL